MTYLDLHDDNRRCLQGGLDLAGAGLDWSALVVAERFEVHTGEKTWGWVNGIGRVPVDKTRDHYLVRLVRRWPRGTDPGDVLASLGRAVQQPELDGLRVRWDATGLGGGLRGVVRDMTRDGVFAKRQMLSVVITAGEQSEVGVPKQDLVSGLSRVVHEQRLHIVAGDPSQLDETLEQCRRELHAYVAKPLESGRFKYEAAGAEHDDITTALALAVYAPMRGSARRVAASYFRDNILTGVEDLPPVVVRPAWRAGEVLR